MTTYIHTKYRSAIGDNQLILTIVCARFLQPPPKFSTLDTFVTGEWNEEQFSTSVVKSSLDPGLFCFVLFFVLMIFL